jgi:hypothetical protein
VLRRTRILDHVWDFAYEGISNVVDQHVAALRRKLDHLLPAGRGDRCGLDPTSRCSMDRGGARANG